MLELLKARRSRKAAVAAIAPLVERSRVRACGIPESTWFDPYIVGFLVTLITVLARQRHADLRPPSLALIQIEAWTKISGSSFGLIGEEIFFLSASRDRAFETGCRDAVNFAEVSFGIRLVPPEDDTPYDFLT